MSRGALRAMFRPYVEFDFTRMAFDTRVSFSRSSTGTYFDAAGVLQTAASNTPRKGHNPATGAVRGLLLEEQRTNLLQRSAEFDNAAWVKSKSGVASTPVVTANYASAPDGSTTASRLQMSLAGGSAGADYARVAQNRPVSVGVTHSKHIYVRSIAGPCTVLWRDDYAATHNYISVSSDWQRFNTTETSPLANANPGIWLRGATATSSSCDILVWGAQLEAGSYPTSYIPTTTATVTRSADVATFTIPPRVVRLVTIYDDGTTSQQAVTPGASYTIPTGQKPILRIRGYFA